MSWSISYTAKDSAIRDTCHLMMLTIDFAELDNEDTVMKFCRLSLSYFLHLSVIISTDINNANSNSFYSRMNILSEMHKKCQGDDANTRKMFYSLQICQPSEQTVDTILSVDFNFNLWIIHSRGDRHKFLSNMLSVHEHLGNFPDRKKFTTLGTGSLTTHDDVDWILQRLPPGVARLIYLAPCNYPNIYARTIELIHTFGYTAVVPMTHSELNKILANPQICSLAAEKYQTTGDVLVARCILQLGSAVSLPLSLEEEYLHHTMARLAHPFLHRKLFISATKIISLYIDHADMAMMVAQSDEMEASEDDKYKQYAKNVSEPRKLIYS